MGTNNNVWGGKGDDVAYVIGEGNTISGNEGDDNAVFVGQNHMFIGGEGDDIGVASANKQYSCCQILFHGRLLRLNSLYYGHQ
jgi:Ca2+-binding RTX toxin-like protein